MTGIIAGILIFVSFYFALDLLNNALRGKEIGNFVFDGVRQQFIGVMAVFANIIPFLVYMRAKKDQAMKGVGLITIVLAFGVLFYFRVLSF